MAIFSTTGSDTYPAGHVIGTWSTGELNTSAYEYTSVTSPQASLLAVLSTTATTGSDYNIITYFGSQQVGTGSNYTYLYCSKNGGAYADVATAILHRGTDNYADFGHFTFIDRVGLTAGTNIYKMYYKSGGGNYYFMHTGRPWSFTVQQIKGT